MAKKIFKVIGKVIWNIIFGLLAIFCIVSAWLMVDKFIIKSPVPSFFGYSTLTIETGSMSGTIEIGDLIVIHEANEYKIGDIVTYLPTGETIPTTHRIINYNPDGTFVTKGDANNVQDMKAVSEEMILGKVVHVFPKVGLFANWVRKEGWLYLVSVLAILGLGMLVLKYNDKKESPDNHKPDENKKADETNKILKAIKLDTRKNNASCLFFILTIAITLTGTLSYSKYVSNQKNEDYSSVATFTFSAAVDKVSSLSFTNSSFWGGTDENKIAMNAVRSMNLQIKNYDEMDGTYKVSSVRMEYSMVFLAPQNFIDKLAIQLFEGDTTVKSPQIVISDLIAASSNPEQIYNTADSIDYNGTIADELSFHVTEQSGTYIADCPTMQLKIEKIIVPMEQFLYFRLWDVSKLTSADNPTVEHEGGSLLSPVKMKYQENIACYRLILSMPEFIMGAGVAETKNYSLQLTITDALDDKYLGSMPLDQEGKTITSMAIGDEIMLRHRSGEIIQSITIEELSREVDGTNYAYTEANPFDLFDENQIQKYFISESYSKNYPFTVNVVFSQIQ